MTRVALGAGGAAWEHQMMADLENHPQVSLARRCVDAADLLAVAGTGQCDVALVDPGLPGLDLDVVHRLRDAGVRVVSVDGAASGGDPESLGITQTIRAGRVGDLAAEAPDRAPRPVASGRVAVVWGPTGAPGRSTFAISYAAAAAASGLHTVLVDADTYGGSIAQNLAVLDDVSALMAACRAANQGRVDEVAHHLVAIGEHLHLLTGIPRADMWVHVRARPFAHVIEHLSSRYDLVVVDTGFGIETGATSAMSRDQVTVHLLETADLTFVVGRADPVGITRLVRALSDAESLLRDPLVVLNGMRASLGWSELDLTSAMRQLSGHDPVAVLPWDQSAIDEALIAGVPVRETTPGSAYALRVDVLSRHTAQVVGSAPSCTG